LDTSNIRSTLNQIFEQRDRAFPKREPENTAAMHEALATYTDILRSGIKSGWRPKDTLVESAKQMARTPVFICGYPKSGTTLLLGLLDGHPELVVMPGDSRMMPLINRHPFTQNISDWEVYWVSRFVNPTGQKPFWIMGNDDGPYLDLLRYRRYWAKALPASKARQFLAVVLAYYCANPRRPARPRFLVEKTPDNERRVDKILRLFPGAYFIHIIRDPYANLASMKRLFGVRGQRWNAAREAVSLRRSILLGLSNQERLGESRYHILRYEDLVVAPEAQMQDIASFLGVPYQNTLLQPTVNGLPARSNSMYEDRRVQGKIISAADERWRKGLNVFEKIVAKISFVPVLKHLS
jgi:hypothetical protein